MQFSLGIVNVLFMNLDIFLSYIVPCYNVEKYLPRCIESLKKQFIPGFGIEIIMVNDGSSDNSLALLQEFAESDSRVVVINQANQGVSASRNAGLQVAKGKYVFFLDSDDWLIEDASQILYEVCNSDQPDIIVANAYYIYENTPDSKIEWNLCRGLVPGLYNTIEFAHRVRRLPISFKAYRREMLINNNICYDEDLQVGEVYAFFLNAMTYSHQIVFTDKRIMNYLVRDSGVMRTVNIERDLTIIDTMHRIESYALRQMPELKKETSYKRTLFDMINMFGISNYIGKSPYSSEVGMLLSRINKDVVYKDLQRFFIIKDHYSKKRTLYALFLFLFPVSWAYRILRVGKRVRR